MNAKNCFPFIIDVRFVGHGAPEGKTTMYLMGGCGETHVDHKIGQAVIQPNRTWSVTLSLQLPCRLRWKWKADIEWEWSGGKDRYTNLSMSSTVVYSNFGQNQMVIPKGKQFKAYY